MTRQRKSKTYKVAERACPRCHTKLDAADDAFAKHRRKPRDGDVSVCLYCGCVMLFDGDGMRLPKDDAEEREILSDERTLKAVRFSSTFRKTFPEKAK